MKSAGKNMDVDAPEMNFGSKPTDGGYLLLSQAADAIKAAKTTLHASLSCLSNTKSCLPCPKLKQPKNLKHRLKNQ